MANETNNSSNDTAKVVVFTETDLRHMLDALKHDIHQANVKRGFYDKEPSDCEQLALIMTEGAEAIEADRKGKHADLKTFANEIAKLDFDDPELKDVVNQQYSALFQAYMKDTVEDELADIFIRLMDYCGWRNVNIGAHVVFKLRYNLTRPYRHGKLY